MQVTMTVNGTEVTHDVEPRLLLVHFLRDTLGLTGTHVGCDTSNCGACTVHLDGEAVRACQVPVSAAPGKRITTIEGLSAAGDHPCQRAWLEEDVAQCGYCQPGMIMEMAALCARPARPSDADVEGALSDHVCRCGTYARIRRAARRALETTR